MTLAVIAGSGALPFTILSEADAILVGLDGVPRDLARKPDIEARFERLGELFAALDDQGVSECVFAGAMGRPALDPAAFDPETTALLPKLMPLLAQGDDALLRGVIEVFEARGFQIRGVLELCPDLLVTAGHFAGPEASQQALNDAARAGAILDALSPHDVGQGCVVAGGQVLGIETAFGTDKMLAGIAGLRDLQVPTTGGVFVKRAKKGQDLRVDLPTIGPDTIAAVQRARLTGISIQAGRVLVLEQDETRHRAQAAGISLWADP